MSENDQTCDRCIAFQTSLTQLEARCCTDCLTVMLGLMRSCTLKPSEEVTAARTQVLPNLTRLDPSDSCAKLPVSK